MAGKRTAKSQDCGPGPGSYTYYDNERKGKGWTMAGRQKTGERTFSPGPGAYDIKSTMNQRPGITMGIKRTTKSLDNTPGPGTYNPKIDKGIAYTMGGRHFKESNFVGDSRMPGLGTYDVDLNKPHNKGYTMGKRHNI